MWREMPVFRAYFNTSLKFLIKVLMKEIFLFSQRPQERNVPPCSPEKWPLWKQTPISRALLGISFGVPSKGAPLQVPLIELPQREMPHFRSPPSFISQSSW